MSHPLSAPHRATAERFLGRHPPPGDVLLCAVTGSHLYGFPSPGSDIDLKGIHQAPTAHLVGLHPTRSDHSRLEVFEGVELDLTTHEVAAALRLLLKGNGNMLERIFSPLQLVDSDALPELRALASRSISRASAAHYRGYLKGMRREHARKPGAKTLLSCVRLALTGTLLLQEGVVESDLNSLAVRFDVRDSLELAAFKREHGEKVPPPAALVIALEARLDDLDRLLTRALDRSVLPRSPTNEDEVNDWLVSRRL